MTDGTVSEAGIWWPFVVMIAGAAATYVWRALGVALSGRIDPEGPAFDWVACVAYGLLAGLIARMILQPSGPLADVALAHRAIATAAAVAAFWLLRRSVMLGVGAGAVTLVVLVLLSGVPD